MLPSCVNVVDDFDGYASDADFTTNGEMQGPWNEGGNVVWMNGSIRTTFMFLLSALVLDGNQPVDGPDCAYTVSLLAAAGGGTHSLAYSYSGITLGLSYSQGQGKLTFQSNPGTNVTLPANLALIRLNNLWYAAFQDATHPTWTFLAPSPMGVPAPAALPANAPFGFGASAGNSSSQSDWDDFGVSTVPSSITPS